MELGGKNPLVQIHDQGAGGNCNVVKEIIYPLGAKIDVRAIKVGDETMSVLEIWGAEYQENDCLLIRPESRDLLEAVCARERCIMQVRKVISTLQPFNFCVEVKVFCRCVGLYLCWQQHHSIPCIECEWWYLLG